MQQLRGREGARVRQIYRHHAERTGIPWTRRQYDIDDWETGDTINRALSAANSSLYGIVHSVIVALGCSPALGFVHTGHHRSFVYDIADLYKAEITVPAAFDVCAELSDDDIPDLDGIVRRRIRNAVHDAKLLTRCAGDIHNLLRDDTDELDGDEPEFDIVTLWDERGPTVPGGTGYEEPS
jgi:CRISPR-associated protein Cas1